MHMKLTLVQLHLKYKWLLHGMQAHRTFQFQLRWNPALDYLVIMTTFLCLNKWNIRSLPFFHNIINLTTLFLWVQIPVRNNPMEFQVPWNSMPWKLHRLSVDRSSMGRASDRVQKKNWKLCGTFKSHYAARKVYYAAYYALSF